MGTPPTYLGVTNSSTAWPGPNTTPKSTGAVVNGSLGDVLVGLLAEFNENAQANGAFSSSPVETWTYQTETTGINNADARCQINTAILSAARTGLNISVAYTTSSSWNFVVPRFSGSEGIGASQSTSGAGQGAVSLVLNTQYDNSAIAYLVMDWSDDGNAARTHRTPSGGSSPIEIGHFNNALDGSATWAYIADAGAAGSKTIGMSAPTGRDQVMSAVEIRGISTPPPKGFLYTEDGFVIRSESGKGLRR